MQTKLGKYQGKPTIKGHLYGDYRKKCELTYEDFNGHCFIHVEPHFGRYWLQIQTKGSNNSIIVQDFNAFIKYALSDYCHYFVIFWENRSEDYCLCDTEQIFVKEHPKQELN